MIFGKLPLGSQINIFPYRPGGSNVNDSSWVFRVEIHSVGNDDIIDSLENSKFVGWERNDKGVFGPKYVDAQMTMDPVK